MVGGYQSEEIPGLVVKVEPAVGEKCERCWTRSDSVGNQAGHPTLCSRCADVVAKL